jgi:uncharacterized protein
VRPPDFTWDSQKAEANRRKHGVTFAEAVTIFEDRRALSRFDELHSDEEDRYLTVGRAGAGAVLAVVHTVPGDGPGRIISARHATSRERRAYHGDEAAD